MATTENRPEINSAEYWARRHRTDWKENEGGHQTLFFAEAAIQHSPLWFLSRLKKAGMSVCDVGCALGQATVALAEVLPDCAVKGVDFSEPAILQARQMFPNHSFDIDDMLNLREEFDVLFLSNILEHFEDPWSALEACSARARRYLWILVPFFDDLGIDEHEYRFTYDNLSAVVGNDFTLCFAKEVDLSKEEATQWPGEQALLIYARESELEHIAPHGCEARRAGDPSSFVLPSPLLAARRHAELSLVLAGSLRQIRRMRRSGITLQPTPVSAYDEIGVVNALAGDPRALLNETNALVSAWNSIVAAIAEANAEVDNFLGNDPSGVSLDESRCVFAGRLVTLLLTLRQLQGAGSRGQRRRSDDELQKYATLMEHNRQRSVELDVMRDASQPPCRAVSEKNARLHRLQNEETARLKAVETASRQEVEEFKKQKSLLEREIEEVKMQLSLQAEEHAREVGDLRREVVGWQHAYRADRISLEAEIERGVHIVQLYQSSRSWRLTRPVRAGARWLKKVLRREGAMFHDAEFMPIFPPPVGRSQDSAVIEAPGTGAAPAIQTFDARREFLDLVEERRASASVLFAQSCTIPWRVPLFQRPQHMARAMARSGAVSVYFSFADEWANDYQELEDNVFLVRDNDTLRVLRNAAVSFYSTSPAHSPELYRQVLEDGNILIYEYIDHISGEISGEGNLPRLRNLFNTAIESADLIAVSARSLMNDVTGVAGRDRVFYLPNAVDLEHYERARVDGRRTVPKPLGDIVAGGRPIIGYFGAIAPWLWYEALDELARRCGRYEFVLLGPDYFGGSKNLPDRSNVHWLGTVDYHDLPLWAQHFDVAMIPFSPGDVARTTSPLKLFEYFALGKPVVVTSEMNECTAFDEVFSGDGPEELAVALESALEACDDHGYVERILHHAEQNSWGHRAATMIEQIERHFRERDR